MTTPAEAKPVKLTRRQAELVAIIRGMMTHGPTLREIAAAMGIRSPNGVKGHLERLEEKGVVERKPGIARGVILTEAYR
jgi:SOS-response transcriptional repressor LexA